MLALILIHESLLAHVDSLNVCASALLFLAALAILWGPKPRIFVHHPSTKAAFIYWMLEWLTFVLIWLLNTNKAFPDLRWFLLTVDLSTICALGFFVAFWEGSSFHWQSTLQNLGLVYGLLAIWNLGFAIRALDSPVGSNWRWIWVFPSETMSAAAFGLIAVAFACRYRGVATSFVLVTIAYIVLQRPVYAGTFVAPPTDPGWVGALALGKLMYGLVFYTLYFVPVENYQAISSPIAKLSRRPRLRKAIHWVGVVAGGVVLSVLTGFASKGIEAMIHRFLSSHP